MKLILCDPRPEIQSAWRSQFTEHPGVEIQEGSVLDAEADAFLLPGNSFGFLDSGLELEVSERYGMGLQDALRSRITESYDGELLVGQAILLRHEALPRPMVYAPIWRSPRKLASTVHVFLAVRGALLSIRADGSRQAVSSLAMPALGTDAGELDARISARQIRYAYEGHVGMRGLAQKNLTQQMRRERKLMSIPGLLKAEGQDAGEMAD